VKSSVPLDSYSQCCLPDSVSRPCCCFAIAALVRFNQGVGDVMMQFAHSLSMAFLRLLAPRQLGLLSLDHPNRFVLGVRCVLVEFGGNQRAVLDRLQRVALSLFVKA